MQRQDLAAATAAYPYTHVQGLYGVPFGLSLALAGATNFGDPLPLWAVVAGLAVVGATLAGVHQYYGRTTGRVTPAPRDRRRLLHAGGAAVAVFFATDQLLRLAVGAGSAASGSEVSTLLVAGAAAMLTFQAVGPGMRRHHVLVWSAVLVLGVLPVWDASPVDVDALAFLPLGAALAVSGVADHLLFLGALRTARAGGIEGGHA